MPHLWLLYVNIYEFAQQQIIHSKDRDYFVARGIFFDDKGGIHKSFWQNREKKKNDFHPNRNRIPFELTEKQDKNYKKVR